MNGSGSPASTPTLLWCTSLVLPCSSSGARVTVAPNATPMAWWPRQTPSSGSSRWAHSATIGTLIPADSGVLGPGLVSTPSNPSSSSGAISSLRRTTVSAPSWAR